MALNLVQNLISQVKKTDIHDEKSLLKFAAYCKEFRKNFNEQVVSPNLSEGKMPSAEDFNRYLSEALLSEAKTTTNCEILYNKILLINKAIEEIPTITLSQSKAGDAASFYITSIENGFFHVANNPDAKKKEAIILLQESELKIAEELANLNKLNSTSTFIHYDQQKQRSQQAAQLLVEYKSQIKAARNEINNLDTNGNDFQNKFNNILINIYYTTEKNKHHQAFKKVPIKIGIFQWMLDKLHNVGLYNANAYKETNLLNNSLENLIQDKTKIFSKEDRKNFKKISKIYSNLSFRDELIKQGYEDENVLQFFGAPTTQEKASLEEQKATLLGKGQTKMLYNLLTEKVAPTSSKKRLSRS